MSIYLISFRQYGYDQYDGFVVVAADKEAAIRVIEDRYPPTDRWPSVDWTCGFEISLIGFAPTINMETILLSSFNAG